jgi:hypothetical protein
MDRLPDPALLSRGEKDALIHALWAQVQALTARVAVNRPVCGCPHECKQVFGLVTAVQ